MTHKVQVNLRLYPETLSRLDQQAMKENRTRNNLLEHIIIKYLDENENKKKEE